MTEMKDVFRRPRPVSGGRPACPASLLRANSAAQFSSPDQLIDGEWPALRHESQHDSADMPRLEAADFAGFNLISSGIIVSLMRAWFGLTHWDDFFDIWKSACCPACPDRTRRFCLRVSSERFLFQKRGSFCALSWKRPVSRPGNNQTANRLNSTARPRSSGSL